MRGTFDSNESLYPCNVTFAGVNEVVVVNHLTGKEHAREYLAGAIGSTERDEQWARLVKVANEANAEIRNAKPLPSGEHIPLGTGAEAAHRVDTADSGCAD